MGKILRKGGFLMPVTTVLFDLDGTLLPMDLEIFVKDYLSRIAGKLAPHGYDPKKMVDTIWRGTGARVQNAGSQSNEAAFWKVAVSVFGQRIVKDKYIFDEFYEEEFDKIKSVCGYHPAAAQIVHSLQEQGFRVVLATNPIFPARATQWRICWAGLKPENFELYTTYENCRYCKPNLNYYRDILTQLNVKAEECLMVGNDVGEDMVAEQLGMKVFLLTDCLINKYDADITRYPQGDFAALVQYLASL